MDRTNNPGRGDAPTGDDEMIRDGSLIIDESAVRREGFVEYEGTVGEADAARADRVVEADAPLETTTTTRVENVSSSAGAMASDDDLSMSSDNTASAGTLAGGGSAPLAQVREGMTVVDANGDEVGEVSYVKMGDPEAMTTMGQEMDTGGFLTGGLFGGGDQPDVPEPFRSELIRDGFVRVDSKGFFGSDRYLTANHIATVSGDTVTLNVTRDSIPDCQG